jgi:hypothetical protein
MLFYLLLAWAIDLFMASRAFLVVLVADHDRNSVSIRK